MFRYQIYRSRWEPLRPCQKWSLCYFICILMLAVEERLTAQWDAFADPPPPLHPERGNGRWTCLNLDQPEDLFCPKDGSPAHQDENTELPGSLKTSFQKLQENLSNRNLNPIQMSLSPLRHTASPARMKNNFPFCTLCFGILLSLRHFVHSLRRPYQGGTGC